MGGKLAEWLGERKEEDEKQSRAAEVVVVRRVRRDKVSSSTSNEMMVRLSGQIIGRLASISNL